VRTSVSRGVERIVKKNLWSVYCLFGVVFVEVTCSQNHTIRQFGIFVFPYAGFGLYGSNQISCFVSNNRGILRMFRIFNSYPDFVCLLTNICFVSGCWVNFCKYFPRCWWFPFRFFPFVRTNTYAHFTVYLTFSLYTRYSSFYEACHTCANECDD